MISETKFTDEKGIDHFHGHAALSGKITKQALQRLKFDNDTLHKVSRLVLYHDYPMGLSAASIRRAINKIGEDVFPYLFEIKRADIAAQSGYYRAEKIRQLEEARSIYEMILENNHCISLHTLAVTGRDLIQAGMKPGKEIGEMLDSLLQIVLENPEKNTKEILMDYAQGLLADE